jgi:hypothetical protein
VAFVFRKREWDAVEQVAAERGKKRNVERVGTRVIPKKLNRTLNETTPFKKRRGYLVGLQMVQQLW